jgi:hypothetical protein
VLRGLDHIHEHYGVLLKAVAQLRVADPAICSERLVDLG